jgi:nucleotide-binding universal stress UspA family protein
MFKTIIIGVDGREGSKDALALARRLAGAGSRLTAVAIADGSPDIEAADTALRATLDGYPDIDSRVFVATSVHEGLHECARSMQADLLVLGSTHRGLVGRLLLGDDARRTLHDAPCPVALAPHGFGAVGGEARLQTVGVGYDTGEAAQAALALAREIGEDAHAAVRVEQVLAERPSAAWIVASGSAKEARERELFLAQEKLDALEGVSARARGGEPTDALLEFAEEVDLLVLGLGHHNAAARLVLGSVADEISGRCPRPLLLVPPAPVGEPAVPAT